MYKQNLHTHTCYCDGKNTPEEVIRAAREQGFDSIGFSGHSFTAYAQQFCMQPDQTIAYKEHIRRLQAELSEEFPIFCGLEFDMYSDTPLEGYDYVIGSVHYLKKDGQIWGFDRSQQEVADMIDQAFGGDGMAFAKCYYETLAQLPEYGTFDILGHPDILCKHSENVAFFDEESKTYRHAVSEALEALRGKIPLFEVNTGAISRGYRTTPYPSPYLLDEFKRLGFGAVVTSDCHDCRYLDHSFTQAYALLKEHGFREIYSLTKNGFVAQPLE